MKFIPLAFLLAISIYSNAETSDIECNKLQTKAYFANYSVDAEAKYSASIRDIRRINTSRLGQQITIKSSLFKYQDIELSNPIYKIECNSAINKEGSVEENKYSNFYGYGTDRKEIKLLTIYDNNSVELVYSFEIVPDELWDLYDGWIYRYRSIN